MIVQFISLDNKEMKIYNLIWRSNEWTKSWCNFLLGVGGLSQNMQRDHIFVLALLKICFSEV